MKVTSRTVADVLVLSPEGPLDHETAEAFQEALSPWVEQASSAGARLILDMTHVPYVSSAGLRALGLAARRLPAGSLLAASLQPHIREVFRISRFEAIVPVHDSVDEALAATSLGEHAAYRVAHHETPNEELMVRFWGTRGSIPTALDARAVRQKIRTALRRASGRTFADEQAIEKFIDAELDFATWGTWGGNSPCVEIETGNDEHVICDLGSGLRPFGVNLLHRRRGRPARINVLLSHVHWDHIMGFPFFPQAYIPGNEIHVYGGHTVLEEALRRQQSAPNFPVEFDRLGATITFQTLDADKAHEIAGLTVRLRKQTHAGDSYGYRIEKGGKAIVYSTDAEHKIASTEEVTAAVEFFRGADLVIFDAMYSLADAVSVKEDWGHSSNVMAVDLCHRAGVKHLCLFHHEPVNDDATLQRLYQESVRYEELMRRGRDLRVTSAYDGLEVRV
jgi:anti-anti-sigma factor